MIFVKGKDGDSRVELDGEHISVIDEVNDEQAGIEVGGEQRVALAIAMIQSTPGDVLDAIRGEVLWRDGRLADFEVEAGRDPHLLTIALALIRAANR